MSLPPFPTDPATLSMLRDAIDPGPDSERTSLWDFLTLMSQLGGSDTDAVVGGADPTQFSNMLPGELEAEVVVMRDPHYHPNDVILALISEIERLHNLHQQRSID